jgi:hypothetical protein
VKIEDIFCKLKGVYFLIQNFFPAYIFGNVFALEGREEWLLLAQKCLPAYVLKTLQTMLISKNMGI